MGVYVVNDKDSRAKEIFGDNLRLARKYRGLTMQQVAERLGYKTADAYGKYERAEQLPSIILAKRIADALGCSLDELTNGL